MISDGTGLLDNLPTDLNEVKSRYEKYNWFTAVQRKIKYMIRCKQHLNL